MTDEENAHATGAAMRERLRGMLAMAVASDDAFNRLSPAGFRLLREIDAALSSPAPEGEAAVTIPYDDFFAAYRYVPRSKMFPDDCLKTRLRALLHEEDLAHADEAEALTAPEGEAAQGVEPVADVEAIIDRYAASLDGRSVRNTPMDVVRQHLREFLHDATAALTSETSR